MRYKVTHKIVQVSRDPFARTTTYRHVDFYSGRGGCWNCGGKRAKGGLFVYGVEKDGITTRIHWDTHAFCSIGCYREYSA